MARERSTPWTLTKAQRIVLEIYDNGEFAHLADLSTEEAFDAGIADCGDGLIRAIMRELDEREDGDEDPLGRMQTIQRQVEQVTDALREAGL